MKIDSIEINAPKHDTCPIIAIANQKGGVGKTTTAINLAQALVLQELRVLLVDLDPQGNASQGVGISLESIGGSVADLIRDRRFPSDKAIYKGEGLDLMPATPALSRVEREMVGLTNSEMRLSQRLSELNTFHSLSHRQNYITSPYDLVILDTPPTFGPLMNSALNAATHLIVPVDSGFFALLGIKELLAEIEEIRQGTNPSLRVLGYLQTLVDPTNIATQTWDTLVSNFGESVFESKIRRSVKLREAPALGRTIFHHAPETPAAGDYFSLSAEVMKRLDLEKRNPNFHTEDIKSFEQRALCYSKLLREGPVSGISGVDRE